jgi:hypothetical protein
MAALPGELAAQRRVMAGLIEFCEVTPLVTSLSVGCSLGRGAADALSDIDAALGIVAECGNAGAGQVQAVESMVVAALPGLGALVDVLRHRVGPADRSSAGAHSSTPTSTCAEARCGRRTTGSTRHGTTSGRCGQQRPARCTHGMACRRCSTTTRGTCRRASSPPSPGSTPRTCAGPRAPVPHCLPRSAHPPRSSLRLICRRRWPATSPMPSHATADSPHVEPRAHPARATGASTPTHPILLDMEVIVRLQDWKLYGQRNSARHRTRRV